jgi:predicted MFS family arabinose efflux permease
MAASFFVLNMSSWIGVIFIGMFLITVGEMFNFPFGNSWAMSRSEGKRQGAYMGMMTMSFAMANIIGHNLGMHLIANYGYTVTWYVMTAILLLAVVFLIWMKRFLEKEKSELVDG